MKRQFILALISASFLFSSTTQAQAFRKGAILLSLSEGTTYSNFNTSAPGNDVIRKGQTTGDRDPITVEYGLTDRWGVGINLGGDVFTVNPTNYYNFSAGGKDVKVITSEVTADAHYHFLVTGRTDISAVGSLGIAGVTIEGSSGDGSYRYNSSGLILRGGLEGRYYITRRLGVLAMLTTYASRCGTKDVKDNTVGNNISTSISGITWEIGLGYRFRR